MQVSRRIQNRWKKGQTEETDTYLMCKYQANRQMYLVSLSLWVRILTVMTLKHFGISRNLLLLSRGKVSCLLTCYLQAVILLIAAALPVQLCFQVIQCLTLSQTHSFCDTWFQEYVSKVIINRSKEWSSWEVKQTVVWNHYYFKDS